MNCIHYRFVRTIATPGFTIHVVKFCWAINAETDSCLDSCKETQPIFAYEHSIGLKAVL